MNAARAVGYFQTEASADDAIVFLLELIHQYEIGAIAGIVIYISGCIGIGDQKAIAPVTASRIADKPEADIALLGRCVLVLTADQDSMYIVHILYIRKIDGKTDHAVIGGKNKGGRWG